MNLTDIPTPVLYFFTIIGICAIALLCVCIIVSFLGFISEFIRRKKWEHKYKHRFDKPPTAKCYCIDCTYFGKNCRASDPNACMSHTGWRVAEDWFCWSAYPVGSDPDLKEKANEKASVAENV